jgi:hypothetical protein
MAKKGASRSGGTGSRLRNKNQEMAARLKAEGVQRPGSTATLPVMEARFRHAKPANFDWSRWEPPWHCQ